MREPNDAVRDHLVRLLAWQEAHAGFDKSVADLPAGKRGECPPGFEHSPWQLLEHLRIAQDDLLDFCMNPKYVHERHWPDDYWPKERSPASEAEWSESIAACLRSREGLQKVVREVEDLTKSVPTGNEKQTYLRAILLAADHVAYHVGQMVAVRKALGVWS